ncbi:MAG: Fe-S cluster assembly sulfur transfer protein SufU [Planctomycetota bacterium]|jgi:nitrogen fixation NifU-like protein
MIEDLYRDLILEHYRCPLGQRPVLEPHRKAAGQNPLCGDECSIAIELSGEGETQRLERIEYRGRGCSISVASGSMMVGEIEGRPLPEVRALESAVKALLQGRTDDVPPEVDLGDLEALEGVCRFPVRVKCALLPWTTLVEALDHAPDEHRSPISTEEAGDRPVRTEGAL